MSGKTRVLLVDDEPLVLDSLREVVMQDDRYLVASVESGTAGLSLASRDDYSVVITDLMLEDISGIELLRSIKERSPETQVIMMSGKGTIGMAVEAMKVGAFDFLTKPYSPSHLLQILSKAKAHRDSLVENKHLRGEIKQLKKSYEIVGAHCRIKRIQEIIDNIAPSDSTVLIQGKSGTGKELVARSVHNRSLRSDGPFQAINCGVFTETLIENELFGHERGAYTGAVQRAIGRVEASAGGTLFLDEIDTMPLSSQVKLLRVLEERCFQRLGGTKSIYADFRLIAAANTDLREAVAKKLLREDLYYRLSVITITLPELRERMSDIPLLVDYYMNRYRDRSNVRSISPEAMDILLAYSWPGNVRELVNAVEYAMVLAKGSQILPTDLPENVLQGNMDDPPALPDSMSLRETERELIVKTLHDCRGNKHLAARMLRIPRSTLYSKIQKHSIEIRDAAGCGIRP